jgi:tetratricopeptide (TPR) repeat protein
MIKKIAVSLTILTFAGAVYSADDENPMALAEMYYKNREYYYAVTEIGRAASLNPEIQRSPSALLLLGKSYRMGNSYQSAVDIFAECSQLHPGTPQGEESLFLSGAMRLQHGSGFYAVRDLKKYSYIYPDGRYIQEVTRQTAYANAFNYDLPAARESIAGYLQKFPDGRYSSDLKEVDAMILEEINRPQKSLAVSVAGSLILPGFGHFYTGRNTDGFLSLSSCLLLGYLAVDSFLDGNRFRGAFYSFIGFSFYQYSLYSAASNVYEYNGQERFSENIKLRISHDF